MPRRKREEDNRTTHQRQRDFLTAFGDCFNVDRAAEISHVGKATHYRWFRKDAKYAAAFEKRKETAGHYLETEAIARAGEGWLEPVFYQGAECGTVRRFDSGLIQFLLRGLLPHRYGSKVELSGNEGAPLQAKIEVVFVDSADSGNAG